MADIFTAIHCSGVAAFSMLHTKEELAGGSTKLSACLTQDQGSSPCSADVEDVANYCPDWAEPLQGLAAAQPVGSLQWRRMVWRLVAFTCRRSFLNGS